MKNLIKNIKKHKIGTAILGICLVGIIGVGTGFGIHQAKVANTQKALLLAQDGYIDTEELNQLGEDIVLGEEIVAPDGSTVVITKDADGNIQTTTIKDSSGNNTGAVVPGGGGYTPSPVPSGHTHTWVAHYVTRQVPHTETINHPAITHKVSHVICNTCGAIVDGQGSSHPCNNGAYCTHNSIETVIDQPAWTEYVNTTVTEQYIDYYYCSECGAHQ